jgi:protein-tyrosine phosphatase
MKAEVYWIDGVWPGKLGLAPRPRGGDWLEDEIADWDREGVSTVVSLLTPDEERDLGLEGEANATSDRGIAFASLPIPDRGVPALPGQLEKTLNALEHDLSSGKNVVVHCRQGIGRTGLVAACLLIANGWSAEAAIRRVSAARGVPVPETEQQRQWINDYAKAPATSR